jgi:hypothetical protein
MQQATASQPDACPCSQPAAAASDRDRGWQTFQACGREIKKKCRPDSPARSACRVYRL